METSTRLIVGAYTTNGWSAPIQHIADQRYIFTRVQQKGQDDLLLRVTLFPSGQYEVRLQDLCEPSECIGSGHINLHLGDPMLWQELQQLAITALNEYRYGVPA